MKASLFFKAAVCVVAVLGTAVGAYAELPLVTLLPPQVFERGTGAPVDNCVRVDIRAGGRAILHIVNGETGAKKLSNKIVRSAVLSLNGALLVGPEAFGRKAQTFDVPVSLIEGENVLCVQLRGKPGSRISVSLLAPADSLSILSAPTFVETGKPLNCAARVTALGVSVAGVPVQFSVNCPDAIEPAAGVTDVIGRASGSLSGFATLGIATLTAAIAGAATSVSDSRLFTITPAGRIIQYPRVEPNAIEVGVPTRAVFKAQIEPDAALLAGQVGLYKVGSPGLTFMSLMHDDGTHGDALAGDGTYTATPELTEAHPTRSNFVVQASYSTAPSAAFSGVFGVDFVIPPSLEVAADVLAVNREAADRYSALVDQLGNEGAMQAVLNDLRNNPIVTRAYLGVGGLICIKYAGGLEGGVSVAPPDTKAIPGSDTGIALSRGDFSNGESVASVLNTNTTMDCTFNFGAAFTLDLVREAISSSGLVYLDTHGEVYGEELPFSPVLLSVGEFASAESGIPTANLLDWKLRRIVPVGTVSATPNNYWAFTPAFIEAYYHAAPNALVVASACSSLANDTMADAFLEGGAATYAGWSGLVGKTFADTIDNTFISRLAGGDTIQDAFDQWTTSERTDPAYESVYDFMGDGAWQVFEEQEIDERIIMLPGGVPLVMQWCPPGAFMMGAYPGEQSGRPQEAPQHMVSIANGFWMGAYEITRAQWAALMGTQPWGSTPPDTLNCPASSISWNDAQSFVAMLNTHIAVTGQGAPTRLPSEAEWEYACRGGSITRFYWGNDPSYAQSVDYAWFGSVVAEIGLRLPNDFGLYDMSGNVWEWCEDDWTSGYTGAPTDGSAWVKSPRTTSRVKRGGAIGYARDNGRSAYRFYGSLAVRNAATGFRVAR